jgi:tetratricopeptide (TPR) repeat protein/TolB-like protein
VTGETCIETRRQLGEIRGGSKKKPGRSALIVVACLILAVALVAVYLTLIRPEPQGTARTVLPDRKYVAVLPFRVLGDEEQLGYLATGLSEAISAKLFQLRELQVSSTSAVEGIDQNAPLQDVARELGVSLIVHGTIQGSGDRIAVTVKLEDVEKGKSLWAKPYSGLIPDLLTLEDQIYNELLTELQVNPSVEERSRAVVHYTDDTKAYDLYLRGRNALRGRQDITNVQTALDFFDQALKQDSNFALAYVGLSDGSLAMYDETKTGDWAQRAVAAGEQAQRLNQDLPEVYFTLGSVFSTIGRQAEAIAVLNRAIELAPNSDEAYRRLGAALVRAGRTPEALAAYQKAAELNPYYWLNYSALGGAHFEIGDYDEALAAFQRVTELEPDNVWGYLNMGAVRFSQGKYEESIPAFQKALAIVPSWDTYSNLGTAYFFLQRYEDAVRAFEKAYELNSNQHVVAGNLADAYRWSGRNEKAQILYERAIKLAYAELDVNPRDAKALSFLALYYSKKGDPAQASELIRRARSLDPDNVEFLYHESVVKLLAGNKEEALNSLGEAISKGYPIESIEMDPELKPLREMPEFEAIRAASAVKPGAAATPTP